MYKNILNQPDYFQFLVQSKLFQFSNSLYVVGISNYYTHSFFEDKVRRLQDSITHMGVSIVCGALTSLLCSVPLFFE